MPIMAHQTLGQYCVKTWLRQINIYLKNGCNGNLMLYKEKKNQNEKPSRRLTSELTSFCFLSLTELEILYLILRDEIYFLDILFPISLMDQSYWIGT